MIRISRIEADGTGASLRVEGRITREAADELALACETHLGAGGPLRLDLSGVRFADAAGVQALRGAVERGTELSGCSGFLRELLKQDRTVDDPDAALLARLREGDEAAFETLVRTHGARLLAVARRIVGAEDEARDVLQNAFLSAFRAIGTFEGSARLSTWLHRIVVNASLMRLRSRRHRPETPIEDLLPTFGADGHQEPPAVEWREPFESLVERREVRSLVRAAIDRLPEAYRTVLLLRDIEELDTEETARALGLTPNAVKSRLHRARQALRTLLDPHFRAAA